MKPFDKINLARKVKGITVSQKVILLTIATHLGENDFAFLSLTTLEAECCLAKDNVSDNVRKLIDIKLITKLPPSDGYRSNRYKINFDLISSSGALLVAPHYPSSSEALPLQEQSTTTAVAERSPKRNINNKEKKNKYFCQPEEFHQKVIDLYHEILPNSPPIKGWTHKRAKLLNAIIQEDEKHQSLDFWKAFFEHILKADFLTGRAAKDNRYFNASLDWMINPENFLKISEGHYY